MTHTRLILMLLFLQVFFLSSFAQRGTPPVKAPFEKLDLYCVNDWWNYAEKKRTDPKRIIEVEVPRDEVICFGMYTTQDGVLKMTAQLFPLYPNETREVRLEVMKKGKWKQIAKQKVNDLGWSTLFRVEEWNDSYDVPYRLLHGKKAKFEGVIRHNPTEKEEIVVASLNCNSNQTRGDRKSFVDNITHFDPDLLFFAGDQSYDHKEHTAAWLLFGKQFRELFRTRPCISIPDDHDIGHGNLWGQNGKRASSSAGNDGGYFYHHEYIKMVERCQTAHLPDAYDPTPVLQGIKVYYTNLEVGGIDFAILEDRKFKTGPNGTIPQMGPRPDHIRDPSYDPKTIDVPGLKLLGDRQLTFLKNWGQEWNGVTMKAVLSQTGFCGGAHRHGNFKNLLHADLDSNGWPQTGRNNALRLIRDAGAVHLAGDQHLPTIVHHGINEFGDGPFAFVAPPIINNYYKRWWSPENEKIGGNPELGNKLPYNGEYLDGMGNKITMHAYANPTKEHPRGGYGIVRFNKTEKSVTFEAWDRTTNVINQGAKQMPGWPRTVRQVKSNKPYIVYEIDPVDETVVTE